MGLWFGLLLGQVLFILNIYLIIYRFLMCSGSSKFKKFPKWVLVQKSLGTPVLNVFRMLVRRVVCVHFGCVLRDGEIGAQVKGA